jgi:hypothetical protein
MLCLNIYDSPLLQTNKINVLALAIFKGIRMVCYLQPAMLTLILKQKRQRFSFVTLRFTGVQFELCSL